MVLNLDVKIVEAIEGHVVRTFSPEAKVDTVSPGDTGFCVQVEVVEVMDLHKKHLAVAEKTRPV
jgi:hypothetical protein